MITPLEKYPALAKAVGLPDGASLSFKREDLHPYGSHKGRSIPVMIDHYVEAGDRKFAISSSGNAALAAALYIKKIGAGVSLDIFTGQNIDPAKATKLKELADEHIRVLTKERPLMALNDATKAGERSLRQSVDDVALVGYESLAAEIVAGLSVGLGTEKSAALFIGTSSGTTAQALAQYFLDKKVPIQVHIVQTSSCHPMADAFESYDGPNEDSIAGAIVDRTAHRKAALIPLIEQTGGRGWVATNEDIEAAQTMTLKHTGLEISPNSALSVAGAMKASELGWQFAGEVICMICGD